MTEHLKTFKNKLLDSLRKEVVTIEFTKKDGTKRVMKCTLAHESIPEEHQPKDKVNILCNDQGKPFAQMTSSEDQRIQPEHTIRVYDVEKSAWRSFITESVQVVNGVPCK